MAISVKDIQEKEFTAVADNAYDAMQVDDYLDEVAAQVGAMTAEKQALNNQIATLTAQVQTLQADLAAAKAEKAEMEKKLPDYNESGYFKNLESAMRESLIGAQRIADETVSEANKKAEQTIADANALAEKTVADANANAQAITESAQKAVAEMKAENDRLHALAVAYRENFQKLINEQIAALNANEALLK